MAKTKRVKSVEQPNVQKITKNPFIFMGETLQGLEIAFQRRENIILWGSGGYGKSDIAQYFFNTKGIEPFIKTMGNGATIDSLLGGFNIKAFTDYGKMEYLLEESFLNHEYVILEELFDAPDYVLEELKDILSRGEVRNGNQIFKIKTEFIICCTNKKAEEFAKNTSLKALIERFKYSHNVKWENNDGKTYGKFFKHVFGETDEFIEILCENHTKKNKPLSPRIAKEVFISFKQFGGPALNFINEIDNNLLKSMVVNYANIIVLKALTEEAKSATTKHKKVIIEKLINLSFEGGFEEYMTKAKTLHNKLQKEVDDEEKLAKTSVQIDAAINALNI